MKDLTVSSTILALDLGTTTGWASFGPQGLGSGTWSTAAHKDAHPGQRFSSFATHLQRACNEPLYPAAVYYERFVHAQSANAAMVFCGYRAILLDQMCSMNNTYTEAVTAAEIKKHMTDKGNANKEQMIQAVKKKGWVEIIDDNHADALALLDLVLSRYYGGGIDHMFKELQKTIKKGIGVASNLAVAAPDRPANAHQYVRATQKDNQTQGWIDVLTSKKKETPLEKMKRMAKEVSRIKKVPCPWCKQEKQLMCIGEKCTICSFTWGS